MCWNFNHCVNFEVFVLVIQSHLSDQENQSRLFGAWRTSSFPSLSYFNCADRFTLCEDAHCWKALVPAFQPRKPNPSWLMATLPFININTTGGGKDKMVFSSESRFFLFLTVPPLKKAMCLNYLFSQCSCSCIIQSVVQSSFVNTCKGLLAKYNWHKMTF